jgi:hypothetical protein
VLLGDRIAGICQFPGGWKTRRDGTVNWVHYGIAFDRDFVGEMKGQAWQDAVVPLTVLYAGEIAEAGLVVLHFRREEKFRRDLEGACRDVLVGVLGSGGCEIWRKGRGDHGGGGDALFTFV